MPMGGWTPQQRSRPCRHMNPTTTTNLTAAQRRFAEREHATTLGISVDAGAVMYRETPRGTYRWIVSPDGRSLESLTFPHEG